MPYPDNFDDSAFEAQWGDSTSSDEAYRIVTAWEAAFGLIRKTPGSNDLDLCGCLDAMKDQLGRADDDQNYEDYYGPNIKAAVEAGKKAQHEMDVRLAAEGFQASIDRLARSVGQ